MGTRLLDQLEAHWRHRLIEFDAVLSRPDDPTTLTLAAIGEFRFLSNDCRSRGSVPVNWSTSGDRHSGQEVRDLVLGTGMGVELAGTIGKELSTVM